MFCSVTAVPPWPKTFSGMFAACDIDILKVVKKEIGAECTEIEENRLDFGQKRVKKGRGILLMVRIVSLGKLLQLCRHMLLFSLFRK